MSHPTYHDMILEAVKNLKDRKGSSRAAIKKYIETNHKIEVKAPAFRAALKKAVEDKHLEQTAQSFKLTAEGKADVAGDSKEPAAPKPASEGTGLYKTIDGKKYDRGMLAAAEKAVSGKHDHVISVEEAKEIVKEALDGGKYTDTEKLTMEYIRQNFKFTDAADTYVRAEVAKFAAKKRGGAKKAAGKKKTAKKAATTGAKKGRGRPKKAKAAEEDGAKGDDAGSDGAASE